MEKGYVLSCEVIAGEGLIACDDNGLSDPYVIVICGSKKCKTKVLRETLNPVWSFGASKTECFTFTHKQVGKSTEILLKLFDWDRFDADDRMGQITIPLKDLKDNKLKDDWFVLVPQKSGDKVSGRLRLKLQIKKASKKKVKHSNLWGAVKTGNIVAVKEHAIKHTDWDETGDEDMSLLHLALAPPTLTSDTEAILIHLLKCPGVKVNLSDALGNTPLHDFCKKFKSPSCREAFDLFIEKGADVNATNNEGETPLHHVVYNPSLKLLLAELLIGKGAQINQKNNLGDTCVHYSIKSGRIDLCKFCVIHKGDFETKGAEGKSAQELASTQSLKSCVRDSLEIANWLRKNGFDKYVGKFVEEEFFLFLLVDMDESAITMMVPDVKDREAILKKAKDMKDGKFMKREDTFLRKKIHIEKQNLANQKENSLRERLSRSVKDDNPEKLTKWEIDIADLEFYKKLGDGASGEVFKGHWRQRSVAIKVLKATNDQAFMDEFIREFSIMANVHSPYLVDFFGATLKEKVAMVMELCARGSLYAVLKDPAIYVGWELGFQMFSDIANGIAVLHHHNPIIVHRDLKTLNVLVTKDWKCKVADFGLSRFTVDENAATLAKCRGTYAYIAPEVFRSEGFKVQGDIYSFSMIIWEIATRIVLGTYEKPFAEFPHLRMDVQVLVQAAKLGKRPSVKPATPLKVGDLITECWDPERDKRPVIDDCIKRIASIKSEYLANKQSWDDVVPKPKK